MNSASFSNMLLQQVIIPALKRSSIGLPIPQRPDEMDPAPKVSASTRMKNQSQGTASKSKNSTKEKFQEKKTNTGRKVKGQTSSSRAIVPINSLSPRNTNAESASTSSELIVTEMTVKLNRAT